MKRSTLKVLAPVSLLALVACSSEQEAAAPDISVAADAAVAPAQEAGASSNALPGLGERPEIPVTLPKMAYVLDYGFRLAGDRIARCRRSTPTCARRKGRTTARSSR